MYRSVEELERLYMEKHNVDFDVWQNFVEFVWVLENCNENTFFVDLFGEEDTEPLLYTREELIDSITEDSVVCIYKI